jgi:tRNA pseudouridine38-40 synthase
VPTPASALDNPATVTGGGVASWVRLRIDLAYDGLPYVGFARQPDQVTVQGELELALGRLAGHPVATICAGRTDRGVHALAQVVHTDIDPSSKRGAKLLSQPLEVVRSRLDQQLGHAITIWQVRRVPRHFDARFDATMRGYRYRLVDATAANPIRRNDRWQVTSPLSVPAMRAAAEPLLGEHDFASFCRKAPGKTTRRRLDELAISRPSPGRIDIRLTGPAFCHQMVRAIVGCLEEVGAGRERPEFVGEVLRARDRSVAARVAPAHGLTLERVGYGRRWPAAPPAAYR